MKALNGEYWVYWNENDELPENEHIKDLIGITHVDFARRFWFCDAFIVRFSEHPTTFAYDVHDAPAAMLQWHPLKGLFQDMWEESYLESELQCDQSCEAEQQKREADQDIILQRMYVTTPDNSTIHDFCDNAENGL